MAVVDFVSISTGPVFECEVVREVAFAFVVSGLSDVGTGLLELAVVLIVLLCGVYIFSKHAGGSVALT